MTHIILIVGGSRSGKSEYARRRAEAIAGPRLFLATAPPLDEEMLARIAAHLRERSKSDWKTIEEFGDIIPTLRRSVPNYVVTLVDCLTLWLNNLDHIALAQAQTVTEEHAPTLTSALLDACAGSSGCVLLVANEVGMGIVPDNPAARRFRDLAGRCNQLLAAAADEVVFVTCGIPVFLKGGARESA